MESKKDHEAKKPATLGGLRGNPPYDDAAQNSPTNYVFVTMERPAMTPAQITEFEKLVFAAYFKALGLPPHDELKMLTFHPWVRVIPQ